jgi:hypothetical protein
MTLRTEEARKWLPFLIAFLAGLLIGWWVIGWGVWPVTYTNALPQDLRAAERDQYLVMTAESFAADTNLDLARSRLSTWPPADLNKDLNNLETRLQTENAAQATQVKNLADGLGVALTGQPGGAQPAATPATNPAAAGSSFAATLGRICGGSLWIVLVVLGVLLTAFLWRRWRAAQSGQSAPAIEGFPAAPARAPLRSRSITDIAEQAKSDWPELATDEPLPDDDLDAEEAGDAAAIRPPWEFTPPTSGASTRSSSSTSGVTPSTPPAAPSRSTSASEATWRPTSTSATPSGASAAKPAPGGGTPVKIGEFMAAYHMGEPGYDEAFDIHDASGAYVGQCGMGLGSTASAARNADQIAAMQVWLWDTSDPDTQTKVLMSEAAYRDTALRDQLAGEHPAMPVRPRTDFELETYNLLVRGVVEKIDYADLEPAGSYFAEMVVRLRIYHKT